MDFEAKKYNNWNHLQIRDAKELMEKITEENSTNDFELILDIGCGSGNVTLLLQKYLNANRIVAIDVDQDMIAFAKEHNSNDSITYLIQDIGLEWGQISPHLKCFEGKISLIFTNHCLHWIRNKVNVVKNMQRLLCEQGKIFANIYWIADLFMKLNAKEKEIHEKEFMKIPTKEEQFGIWFNLFKNHGLTINSENFIIKDGNYELEIFEEKMLPFLLSLGKIYYSKDDSHKNQAKIDELFWIARKYCKKVVDKDTGKIIMNFKYGFYQFVLSK